MTKTTSGQPLHAENFVESPMNWVGMGSDSEAIQKGLEKKCSRSETQFYNGKFHAFRFFFSYELPKVYGLAPRLMDSDRVTVEMQPELFND